MRHLYDHLIFLFSSPYTLFLVHVCVCVCVCQHAMVWVCMLACVQGCECCVGKKANSSSEVCQFLTEPAEVLSDILYCPDQSLEKQLLQWLPKVKQLQLLLLQLLFPKARQLQLLLLQLHICLLPQGLLDRQLPY